MENYNEEISEEITNDINENADEENVSMNQESGETIVDEAPAEKAPKKKGNFWVGMACGFVSALFCIVAFIVAENLYYYYKYNSNVSQSATIPGTTLEGTESVVNDETTVKMAAIQSLIDNYYYQEVDETTLENGVYYGMVDSIGDIYSEYYSQDDLKKVMEDNEGIYYGIGAYIGLDESTNTPKITSVMPGTPAEEAGLRDGDIIYKVDDVVGTGMTTSEIVTYIKGPEHTKVMLTIVREGEDDYLEIEVERRKIESPTVNSEMLDNNIGYIEITEFDEVTADQFTEAFAVLKGQGMKGLILDLRSNPGGSVQTCCSIARHLLPKGLIVYTEDKYGKREEYTCDGATPFDKPLVVLVNAYSASASEILTGAIKDYGIGTIMGTKTYGKGIVQRIIPMTDGSAVKLTISKYYTPSGVNIHGTGIEPDIEVEFDGEKYYSDEKIDNQKDAAYEYILEQLQ